MLRWGDVTTTLGDDEEEDDTCNILNCCRPLLSLQDGRAASAVAVCSFLCFCRLFTTAEAAVYMLLNMESIPRLGGISQID